MPQLFKQNELDYRKDKNPHPKFNLLTAMPRLFSKANSKHLYFDMRKLTPGQYSFPYHFHHNSEELFVIHTGSVSLRTPNGIQILNPGDIVFFEIGESGSHQLYNHGTEACIYLDIRTNLGLDISEYPDSQKVNIIPLKQIYKKETNVGYHEGEDEVEDFWKGLSDNN